jgi:hypothetical protein
MLLQMKVKLGLLSEEELDAIKQERKKKKAQ